MIAAKTMLTTLLRVLIVAVVVMFVDGCQMKPNVREFYRGNAMLTASLNKGEARYVHIEVDHRAPGNTPPVLVELPNGETVALANLDVAVLERLGAPQRETELYDSSGAKPIEYSFRGLSVVVSEGRVVRVMVWTDPQTGTSPGLWDMSRTRRYVLPLNEREVRELFGEPDKTADRAVL